MQPITPRPPTEHERQLLFTGLESLRSGESMGGGRWIDMATQQVKPLDESVDPAPYIKQIDALQIIGKCNCSDPTCATVYFQGYSAGKSDAIVFSSTGDGRMLIIHINEDTDQLAELEII